MSREPQFEKAHLQFCKRYLEVNNKASNIACRAELGRFPLNITINQKILKYILYIQSKDEESLVKQASLMSFDLNCNGKNSLHSHLMNMSEYFKLPDIHPDLLDIAMVKRYGHANKARCCCCCCLHEEGQRFQEVMRINTRLVKLLLQKVAPWETSHGEENISL